MTTERIPDEQLEAMRRAGTWPPPPGEVGEGYELSFPCGNCGARWIMPVEYSGPLRASCPACNAERSPWRVFDNVAPKPLMRSRIVDVGYALALLEGLDLNPPRGECRACESTGILTHERDDDVEPGDEIRCGWCDGDGWIHDESRLTVAREAILTALVNGDPAERREVRRIPITGGGSSPTFSSWLRGQPGHVQRAVLGDGKTVDACRNKFDNLGRTFGGPEGGPEAVLPLERDDEGKLKLKGVPFERGQYRADWPNGTPWIQLSNGMPIDLIHPSFDGVDAETIARSLVRLPRFAGNTLGTWSVLDHSLLCLRLLTALSAEHPARFEVLMHDAHECVTGDIPTPVKRAIGGDGLTKLDRRLQLSLGVTFGLDFDTHKVTVKEVDLAALHLEVDDLMATPKRDWNLPPAPHWLDEVDVKPCRLDLTDAEVIETFVAEFCRLTRERI
jgi:hypothetical protein